MKNSKGTSDARCLWCHKPLKSLYQYYRAIDPGIKGAFAAVCGKDCTDKPSGARILEKVGK